MASGFGIAVTNLTSKLGILSRKACMRIAAETGKKVVDKSKETGRIINKEEIEQIFAETLPKRCRPKIITTNQEAINIFKRTGHNEEEINQYIQMPFAAAVLGNGTKKYPIWIPFERLETILPKEIEGLIGSVVGHELEHALEKNNRFFDIFRRKFSSIKESVCKFFDKEYKHKVTNRETDIHNFEFDMQNELINYINQKTGKLACKPTVKNMEKYLKEKTGRGLIERLRSSIRKNYASPENAGSEQIRRFDKINYWLDMEKAAYQVSGEIDRYILGISEDEHAVTESISKLYEAAIDIVKKDRRSYWKNLLLGKLKKPNVYATDKDLLMHASGTEEKQVLQQLLSGLNKEQKSNLIKVLYSFDEQPNAIQTIKQFLDRTTVKGTNNILKEYDLIENCSLETLSNPHFIQIARMANSNIKGSDALLYLLHHIKDLDAKQMTILAGKIEKTAKKEKRVDKFCEKIFHELDKKAEQRRLNKVKQIFENS